MKATCVALVPMRHQSVRVPGKNYRLFAGKPLYHHIVRTLQACPSVSRVVIDTDSPVIIDDAARHFPDVLLIERPEPLRADTIPTNDVLLHDVNQVEADLYLQTHSTNPLLKAETIERAIDMYRRSVPAYDSIFSVTRLQTRLWDEQTRAMNHDPDVLLRTQDLPPVYEENSCFYLFARERLIERKNRMGYRPLMFEVDRLEAWDIDEELDFRIAELLYKDMRSREG